MVFNHKNYNFRERRTTKLRKKGKICIKILTKEVIHFALKLRLVDLNYNFNVIG